MLDLLISYLNFLVLSIGYIVKRLTFFPPKPPGYLSVKTEKDDEDDILFQIKVNKKQVKYVEIKFKSLEYRFIKIINKNKEVLPILLFKPPSHIPVCIIYSHGNSGDLGACILEYYDIAINTNCLVVSFEYPGFGDCMDQPMKESLFYRNMKMTYYFVRRILGYKPEQIILYGFSIGTGIIFDFACQKEYPTAGVILQSPILSVVRTLYNINTTMYFDLFNNCDKAKNLKTKTFFIHGNKDSVVPYIHGRILAKLIPQEYYYDFFTVENANHNNLFKFNKDMIFKKIRQFIKDCTGQFTDFSKLNSEENNSSDTTIDNNKINSDNSTNKNNDNDIKNQTNNSNDQIINLEKNFTEQKLNLVISKQIENNNLNKSLNQVYQYQNFPIHQEENKNNKINQETYFQNIENNLVNNFFGYNPHDLQNDINNYMNNNNNITNNNSTMNNFL